MVDVVLDAYPGVHEHGRQLGPDMYDPAVHKMACAAPPAQPYPAGQEAQLAQPAAVATLVEDENVPTEHPQVAG